MKKVLPEIAPKITACFARHDASFDRQNVFAHGRCDYGRIALERPYRRRQKCAQRKAGLKIRKNWRKTSPSRRSNIRYSSRRPAKISFLIANARFRSKAIRGRICNMHMRARGRSLRKAKEQNVAAKLDLNAAPSELSRLLHRFPEVVERAAQNTNRIWSRIIFCRSRAGFNSWYAQEQILDGTPAAPHKLR